MTRLRGRLDHILTPRLHRGLSELDPTVLEILRIGAYQLLYMDGVPAYAAVSESVEQSRAAVGPAPTGLVNAVLRQVARVGVPDPPRTWWVPPQGGGSGANQTPAFDTDPIGFLETWGSHPRWLLERWMARWDGDAVRRLVEANNRIPATYLLPLGTAAPDAAAALAAGGIESEAIGQGTDSVRLGDGTMPADALAVLPQSIVQDPASSLVVRYADVSPGMKVADLCAAPGGKALALADRALYTLAADRSESRLLMVKENARRAGRPLGLVVADARHPPLRGVDLVLLDAPCSGTGTLARRPDARWRLRPESLRELVDVQRDMLHASAEVLGEGGLLVYSTCSLETEENEGQVEAFLACRSDFRLESTDAVPTKYLDSAGHLSVTPQETGFDGAFAARLRKTG